MAGLYIHIPFCKQKCIYCDFYSETRRELIPFLVEALAHEMELRCDYVGGEVIDTVYFGGGTPSLLKPNDFERLFAAIDRRFTLSSQAEVTLEANPDDLTEEYVKAVTALPFNRISMGVQSFDDYYLGLLNRRHTAKQALQALERVRRHGIDNVSLDLIYGLPYQATAHWENDLDRALDTGASHLSAYGLTYEEGTPLWKLREDERIAPATEEEMNEMYRLLLAKTEAAGLERYEISNFARPGFRSRHNSAYWRQVSYVGIGPAAHSFDGRSRQWNVSSIEKYIGSLARNLVPAEREVLSPEEQYNDFVMVSLRTAEGIDLKRLEQLFGGGLRAYCEKNMRTFLHEDLLERADDRVRLTTEGILVSNRIMAELMKV